MHSKLRKSVEFGLTALEALSAGLPVLVSQNTGFGEALSKVPFGEFYVINSEDPSVWASAIKRVWKKDRATRLQETENLRAFYGQKYNWERQCNDLVEILCTMDTGKSKKYETPFHDLLRSRQTSYSNKELQSALSTTHITFTEHRKSCGLRKKIVIKIRVFLLFKLAPAECIHSIN